MTHYQPTAESAAAGGETLAALRPLSRQFPTVDAAIAEIARLSGELTLPKGTIHVISDIHGEYAKLRHVLNNASGMLRPLAEALFRDRLSPAKLQEFLTLIFYPKEKLALWEAMLPQPQQRREFAEQTLAQLFILLRALAHRANLPRALSVFPADYRALLQELLYESAGDERSETYIKAIADALMSQGQAQQVIRLIVRVVRNLAIDELIIAGDCWDRGPRGDRVMEYIRRQPNVAITWGNHDAAWLGACLGQDALIAHVLRISLRYGRLTQLEEGYGIPLQPLEQLADAAYGDDAAECYRPKGSDPRDALLLARMQKAAAIMQFKLEGQTIQRNPHYDMDHRRLLHRIDRAAGTIAIDGLPRKLRDTHFPTINPADPYTLSAEEFTCMARLRQSFTTSRTLWEHMRYLVSRGSMWLIRDDHLIFHGCVAVDERGEFLPLLVDGRERRGRDLFDAFERVVIRAMERPSDADRDWLWYLWCGPRSPLFGKDRIATLEIDLVADKATHEETKNPYFHLIHDAAFCEKVLAEFGADPQRGLIVNGHVPVKIDKGESPLKKSGKAITIDGAFSEAYGDRGYTLVLEPEHTLLAEHHHFDSVEAAVKEGKDIMPVTTVIHQWQPPRRIIDTEQGDEIRAQIQLLGRLVEAYRGNKLRQGSTL
jgi:fructose-1,6-bisphosphatase-3